MCTSISIYYGSKFSTGTAVKHTTVSYTVYCTYIALQYVYTFNMMSLLMHCIYIRYALELV